VSPIPAIANDRHRSGGRAVKGSLWLAVVSLVAISPGPPAGSVIAGESPRDNRRDAVVLRHCEVEYEQSTTLSGHSGIGTAWPLQECLVHLGDRVKEGQVIGRLADRELRIQLALLKAQAESEIEVRLAESKRNELTVKLKRIQKLRDRIIGYTSEEEYDVIRTQAESAQLAIEEAEYKRRIAKMQSEEMEAQIRNRAIVAPHDGIVVEVYKKPGESVIAGQPVFQIVEADRLRVTAYANVRDYTRIRPGQRIEVSPEIEASEPAGRSRKFEGQVIFVDPRIDSKSQTCRIVARARNQDLALTAGLEACMTIFTTETTSDSSSSTTPLKPPAVTRTQSPFSRPAPSR
jgi:HlyD family secretion protein